MVIPTSSYESIQLSASCIVNLHGMHGHADYDIKAIYAYTCAQHYPCMLILVLICPYNYYVRPWLQIIIRQNLEPEGSELWHPNKVRALLRD